MSYRPTSVTRCIRLLGGWQSLGEAARPGLSEANGLTARQRMGFPSCCQQWQSHRGAQIRARRSPTVRALEKQHKIREQPEGTSRPGPRIFPDDSSVLLPLFEKTIPELDMDITADECMEIIDACQKVLGSRMAIKESALKKDYGITPFEIHSVALLLLYNSVTTAEGRQYMALANLLLHLAGTAPTRPGGYLPSTLTIVNIFNAEIQKTAANEQQRESQRKMGESHFYQSAETRFLAYLAKNQTDAAGSSSGRAATLDDMIMQANAFTQAGVVAEGGGDSARALRWFRAARGVGMEIPVPEDESSGSNSSVDDTEPRKPKWDWERRCLEAIGRLQAAEQSQGAQPPPRGETYQEARAAVRTAALALNSGEACLLLATVYAEGETDEVVQMLLYRAATAAIPGAAAALAERAEAKAIAAAAAGEARETQKLATEEQLLAKEWRAIAAAAVLSKQ